MMQEYASIQGEESRRNIMVNIPPQEKKCILIHSAKKSDIMKSELVEKEKTNVNIVSK